MRPAADQVLFLLPGCAATAPALAAAAMRVHEGVPKEIPLVPFCEALVPDNMVQEFEERRSNWD